MKGLCHCIQVAETTRISLLRGSGARLCNGDASGIAQRLAPVLNNLGGCFGGMRGECHLCTSPGPAKGVEMLLDLLCCDYDIVSCRLLSSQKPGAYI